MISNMLSYFRPLPPGLMEHIGMSPWCHVLTSLGRNFGQNTHGEPYSFWRDIDGLGPDDEKIFRRVLNLDPMMKPSAEEVLNDQWLISP